MNNTILFTNKKLLNLLKWIYERKVLGIKYFSLNLHVYFAQVDVQPLQITFSKS
jgi:hypothetical protein